MLRAMREVIMPAIAPQQRLALDQAAILIGNLKLMAEQQAFLLQYQLVELREYAALLRALRTTAAAPAGTSEVDMNQVGASGQGGAGDVAETLLAQAAPLAETPIPTFAQASELTTALKAAADELLQHCLQSGSSQARREATALVMAQSERQITRERRWFRAAGFELEPEKLASLEQVLK